MPGIGFTLQPDQEFLDLCEPLIAEAVDYLEVTPETTWYREDDGTLVPNGYHARFLELGARFDRTFVGHGIGFSMGTVERDEERDRRWIDALRRDQGQFHFGWYTEHLGATVLGGEELALPLPVRHSRASTAVVRRSLARLSAVVSDVGLENTAFPFWLDDPMDEPRWFRELLEGDRRHLLLDLHNLVVNADNAGFDPLEYLERLPLQRVIEVHLSGGDLSDPAWLPSGRRLRLDAHDSAIPEEVWALAENAVPRCPNLRGVTVERMEGTVGAADVPLLREELKRARALCG